MVSALDDQAGHHEQLWLVPLAGGEPVALTPPAGRIRNPSWAPDGGWVAFESDAASFRDLYRVERDGAGLRRLTEAPFGSFEPAISPDGARIAFGTSRDGNAELYVMAADGSDPRRLTTDPADDTHPRWLPDGRIGWIATRGRPRVWTVGADGSDPRPVREPDGDAVDLAFEVSREGRIAIVVQRGPELALEIVAPQGTSVVDGPGPDEHPAWSPDGRWLVFSSSREGGQPDLWRVDADGAHPERLTTDPAAEWLPRWLPTR